jgi:hypothetical protein
MRGAWGCLGRGVRLRRHECRIGSIIGRMRYWLAVLVMAVAWGQEPGTATVRGRVVIQATQEPVEATILIDGFEGRAGMDGFYRLTRVPAGPHVMEVRSRGFKVLRLEMDLKPDEDVDVPVAELRLGDFCGRPDEPPARLRWVRTEGGVIRGTVWGRGAELRDVTVTLTNANGLVARTSSDARGLYVFEKLPSGRYEVTFQRAGYWPKSFHTTAVVGLETFFEDGTYLNACPDGTCKAARSIEPRICE